MLKFSVILQSG